MDEPGGTGELVGVRAGDAAGDDAGQRPGNGTGHDAARAAHAVPALIEFEGVGHTYRSFAGRSVRAVESFTLSVGESEIFGLAGPNGAGKSTLIALLLGYLEPTNGRIRVAGLKPREFVERHGIGYLSELVAVPPRWTVDEALKRFGILAGIRAHELPERIDELVALLGLEEHRAKRAKQLSKGNLQRLGLAQALLRRERVLILDEPTHGLDPVWTQKFRDIVHGLRHPGRAIFIASHNLDELQRLADRVAIIDHGALQRVVEPRLSGSMPAMPYVIVVTGNADVVLEAFPRALRRGENEFELPPLDLATLNAGLADLIQRGAMVSSLRPAHSVLEQHFREAVGDTTPARGPTEVA